MPAADAKLDIRTSPVTERIAAINDFVAAGYEEHVNLSPVVIRDGWLESWAELLEQLDDALNAEARQQLAAEMVFLTHNERLHEVNLGWHPQAEEMLWRPDVQHAKRSQAGGYNVRYRTRPQGPLRGRPDRPDQRQAALLQHPVRLPSSGAQRGGHPVHRLAPKTDGVHVNAVRTFTKKTQIRRHSNQELLVSKAAHPGEPGRLRGGSGRCVCPVRPENRRP
nr:hypothetical protein [Nonomuraea diastatica]